MKGILAVVAVALAGAAGCASTSYVGPIPAGARTVYEAGEDDDAWLHAHCAYLGTFPTTRDHLALKDGEIAILVGRSFAADDTRTAKRFACKEKPAFYTETFRPVSCDALEKDDRPRCETRFAPPPPPPVVVVPAEPPPPPASAPPEKPSKKEAKTKKASARAPTAQVVRTPGF